MNLIVCLDMRNGMSFGGRRQSMDRVLRERMLAFVGKQKLWMNSYSAKQFSEGSDGICIDDDFLNKAGTDDYCFVEISDAPQYLPEFRKVIIYRWDRVYPSDVVFPPQILSQAKKISECTFAGNSHKEITQEVYSLCE